MTTIEVGCRGNRRTIVVSTPRPRRKHPRPQRARIFERDDGRCRYCNVTLTLSSFTLDHVTPRANGGKDNDTNLVVACRRCNARKANRTPEQAKMRLRPVPSIEPVQRVAEAVVFIRVYTHSSRHQAALAAA